MNIIQAPQGATLRKFGGGRSPEQWTLVVPVADAATVEAADVVTGIMTSTGKLVDRYVVRPVVRITHVPSSGEQVTTKHDHIAAVAIAVTMPDRPQRSQYGAAPRAAYGNLPPVTVPTVAPAPAPAPAPADPVMAALADVARTMLALDKRLQAIEAPAPAPAPDKRKRPGSGPTGPISAATLGS